eukprot:1020690-Pelagomonas_calceolata.AAC.3
MYSVNDIRGAEVELGGNLLYQDKKKVGRGTGPFLLHWYLRAVNKRCVWGCTLLLHVKNYKITSH